MNAAGYVKVLEDNLIPIIRQYFQHRPCIFQQDNAAVHTANEVETFFEDHKLPVLDWPAHSPDLNIIEHVWHYLKGAMKGLPVASNQKELWSNAKLALAYMWSPEMTQKINVLYESLPNRMQAVITAHGGFKISLVRNVEKIRDYLLFERIVYY
jgi:transposase